MSWRASEESGHGHCLASSLSAATRMTSWLEATSERMRDKEVETICTTLREILPCRKVVGWRKDVGVKERGLKFFKKIFFK